MTRFTAHAEADDESAAILDALERRWSLSSWSVEVARRLAQNLNENPQAAEHYGWYQMPPVEKQLRRAS